MHHPRTPDMRAVREKETIQPTSSKRSQQTQAETNSLSVLAVNKQVLLELMSSSRAFLTPR